MLRLHFHGMLNMRTSVGPAPYFRFAGNEIKTGPADNAVAQLVEYLWYVHDAYFAHFEAADPVMVHFESENGESSDKFGPYTRFHGSSGVTYVNDTLFAHLVRKSGEWCDVRTARSWAFMVVSSTLVPTLG